MAKRNRQVETGTGKVKWFRRDLGYGFIGRTGDSDLFFRASDVLDDKLQHGSIVQFEIGEDTDGRPVARKVRKL